MGGHVQAVALALQKVPECNSSWSDDFIRQYNSILVPCVVYLCTAHCIWWTSGRPCQVHEHLAPGCGLHEATSRILESFTFELLPNCTYHKMNLLFLMRFIWRGHQLCYCCWFDCFFDRALKWWSGITMWTSVLQYRLNMVWWYQLWK